MSTEYKVRVKRNSSEAAVNSTPNQENTKHVSQKPCFTQFTFAQF
jgi:hypothetical protein